MGAAQRKYAGIKAGESIKSHPARGYKGTTKSQKRKWSVKKKKLKAAADEEARLEAEAKARAMANSHDGGTY